MNKTELLLQIIAGELYIARTDREYEGASGSGPEIWRSQGRDQIIREIENSRERLDKDE